MSSLAEQLGALQAQESALDADLKRIDEASISEQGALVSAARTTYLGRKSGVVTELMSRLASLPPSDKKEFGRRVNDFKNRVESALTDREAQLAASRRPAHAVDVTMPGLAPTQGFRHPLSLIRDEVEAIFSRLGYQVLEGPEIEDDYHNFEALNMPAEHPARDMQDTLYLAEPLPPSTLGVSSQDPSSSMWMVGEVAQHANPAGLIGSAHHEGARRGKAPKHPQPLTLLRTHTSAMQIRHMERHDPPVRMVAIGPVYRRDNLDLSHTPMFHQVEGLVVGSGITLADLKGTLTSMAAALFGEGTGVRFRPSFFPYTEPSAEVDIQCIRCKGAGCPMCKQTGWLEILGSGMVHPCVFESVGYDPEAVTGFAFGMGIERVALLKWDVEDIRLFYENDLRFLEQFRP
jgi:phenylalanyl-tRNA synthetase alpha chain